MFPTREQSDPLVQPLQLCGPVFEVSQPDQESVRHEEANSELAKNVAPAVHSHDGEFGTMKVIFDVGSAEYCPKTRRPARA